MTVHASNQIPAGDGGGVTALSGDFYCGSAVGVVT
jgi:hypothetical protein